MDKKVSKNYIYSLIYLLTNVLVPLLTTPYISRVLHLQGVGIYSYTNAIATGFSLFAALGINNYGQREVAYYQDNLYKKSAIFWEIMIIRGINSFIIIIFYLLFCFCYKEYTVYLLQQIFIIAAVMFDISWFFQGIENFKIVAVRNMLIKSLLVTLTFMIVKDESDLNLYILINSLSVFVGNVIFWGRLKKDVLCISWQELNIVRHIRGSLEFFIPLIAVQIYSHLDKIMLGALANTLDENGYYEQSRKIINVANSILVSLNTVLFPRISNLYVHSNKNQIIKIYKEAIHFFFFLLFPIIIGIIMISDNLVIWFLGEEFSKVAYLLKISTPLLLFMGIGNFVGTQYLIPTGKQNIMTLIYIISAIINVIFNFWLIPRLYSVGALVSSCLAEFISCFLQVILLKRGEFNFSIHEGIWKYLISAMIMGSVLIILNKVLTIRGISYTIIQIFVGIIIYLLTQIVLNSKEIKRIKKFFKVSKE